MKKNQSIAILKKTIASLIEKRASFLESLADATSKLNSANTELAQLMGAPAPQMLRVAGMTKTAATKGANETAWIKKYGKRCRLQDKTIKTFNLSGDRESMIGQFAKLRESGKAVLTVTGWQLAGNAPAKVSAAKPSKKAAPIKQNKKAKPAAKKTPAKSAKATKKVATPAKKSTVSEKARKLAAEVKESRPTPASQVAIMG